MADRHSRIVAVLKVVLPLGALVLLSMVFLISRSIDPERAVEMATVDIESLVREPRITDARFAGVLDDGAALTVRAETARADPDRGLRLDMSRVQGTLRTETGRVAEFAAQGGILDQPNNLLSMDGGVTFSSDGEYVLRMDRMTAALDRTVLHGFGNVQGRAPAGELRADVMTLREAEAGADSYVLVFRGAVKLIYSVRE
ncbi:MAG: hypothetical protein JJU42_02610 [Rhodobacteraceae bacterium]|nr:hypothetical protein [Paracoccaceae bacterium]